MKNFKSLFKSASRATAALVLGVMVSTSLFAAAPAKINYQGKLTDSSGIPINVATNVEFAVENLAGAQQWASGTLSITPVNGVFNQILDVPESVIQANTELYLELRVAGTPMVPRQRLVAAPYALAVAAGSVGVAELNTTSVDGRYVGKSGNETIDGDKTLTGNWVNTTNPWADNEVSDTLTVGAAGSVAAAAVQAGVLGGSVRVSSVAVNSVYDSAIVGLSASKLTGALPAIDGSALTGVLATGVGPNSIGTAEIIAGTIAVSDLNTSDIDTRYATLGTAQTLTGIKTLNANWVNTANPWADDEVSNVLSVLAGSTVSASAIDVGTLPSDVIASSVAVNAVTTSQILNNTIALSDLNTGDVDLRYVTTGTAQGITGLKTFSNGVVIGASGDNIAQYVSVTDSSRNIGNLAAGASTSFTVAVPGTALGDVVIVTPRETTWLSGVFLLGYVSSAGNVTVNVKNTDAAPSNVGTVDFQISVIQH